MQTEHGGMIHSELARSTGDTTPEAGTTVATLAVRALIGLLLGLAYLAVMLGPGAAAAQGVPVCGSSCRVLQ